MTWTLRPRCTKVPKQLTANANFRLPHCCPSDADLTYVVLPVPEELEHVHLPLQSAVVVLSDPVDLEGDLHGVVADGVRGVDDAAAALADLVVHPVAVLLRAVGGGHNLALKVTAVEIVSMLARKRGCF